MQLANKAKLFAADGEFIVAIDYLERLLRRIPLFKPHRKNVKQAITTLTILHCRKVDCR